MPLYNIKVNKKQKLLKMHYIKEIYKVYHYIIIGLRINVEWSKKSGRYDENREPRRERGKDDRGGYLIIILLIIKGKLREI